MIFLYFYQVNLTGGRLFKIGLAQKYVIEISVIKKSTFYFKNTKNTASAQL